MDQQDPLSALGETLSIPTLPAVVMEVNRMVADPTLGASDIGAVIASDPGLASKVLQVANSSFFGLSEEVLSAEHAATVIGGAGLKNIALQASIMGAFEKFSNLPDFDLEDLWNHSLFTAQVCRLLASRSKPIGLLSPDDFYTCGLLHDVGKVVLLDNIGDEYLEVIRLARHVGQALHVCEKEQLGYTHVDVGVRVSTYWDFPAAIQGAIAYHHGPKEQVFGNPAVALVAIADQLTYRAASSSFESAAERLGGMAGALLGMTREDYAEVVNETSRFAEEAEV